LPCARSPSPPRLLGTCLLVAVLAGCLDSGTGRPATDPRFVRAVRDHYNANAAEPAAGCERPTIVLLRSLQTTQSFAGQGVLRMVAELDFEQRDPRTLQLVCSGQSRRFFSVLRADPDPPRVLGMSGPTRPGA
jgi:hypothetical protein